VPPTNPQIFVGTNTYITFGGGSSAYSGLSASNPPYPTIFLGSADHSFSRLGYRTDGETYTYVYYGGAASTGGSTVNIEWEALFTFDGRIEVGDGRPFPYLVPETRATAVLYA
jgi:hypothetical protein